MEGEVVAQERKPSFPTENELLRIKLAIAEYNGFPRKKDELAVLDRESEEWRDMEDMMSIAHIAVFHHYMGDTKIAMVAWETDISHYMLFKFWDNITEVVIQAEEMKA
jgi:hypothetical protein